MKRTLCTLFSLIIVFSTVFFAGTVNSSAASASVKLGDLNSDRIVNSTDALIVLKSSIGINKLSNSQTFAADMNTDGEINSTDALRILRISIGTIPPARAAFVNKLWKNSTAVTAYGVECAQEKSLIISGLFQVNLNDTIYLSNPNDGYSFKILLYKTNGAFIGAADCSPKKNTDSNQGFGTAYSLDNSFINLKSKEISLTYPLKIRVLFSKNNDTEFSANDIARLKTSLMYLGTGSDSTENRVTVDFSDYSTLDPAWMITVVKNYNEFTKELTAKKTAIPFIASSDQHGSISADSEVFKFISDLTEWDKVSKIINLGDTSLKTFNEKEMDAYSKAMKSVPIKKRLELPGNHDAHSTDTYINLNKYFIASGAVRSKDNRSFCVEDKDFNVRYLCVDTINNPFNYNTGFLSSEQADFIVKELEKNDKSDIIFLSHSYLFNDNIIARDSSTFSGMDWFIGGSNPDSSDSNVKKSFINMLTARKSKTSGTLIDSDGKTHKYDFTKCNGNLLMSLHGHHHSEGYKTSNGITEFLFQSFRYSHNKEENEPNCFYFAYVDRDNKKFKCWKNAEGYSAWQIKIA